MFKRELMIPLNVFKVGISTMTVVENRPVHHAKTTTLGLWALIAIDILMEVMQTSLPVPLLIIQPPKSMTVSWIRSSGL